MYQVEKGSQNNIIELLYIVSFRVVYAAGHITSYRIMLRCIASYSTVTHRINLYCFCSILHCIAALYYSVLHVTLHDIRQHCIVYKLQYNVLVLYYLTLYYIKFFVLHYMSLHCLALQCSVIIKLQCLHCIVLQWTAH